MTCSLSDAAAILYTVIRRGNFAGCIVRVINADNARLVRRFDCPGNPTRRQKLEALVEAVLFRDAMCIDADSLETMTFAVPRRLSASNAQNASYKPGKPPHNSRRLRSAAFNTMSKKKKKGYQLIEPPGRKLQIRSFADFNAVLEHAASDDAWAEYNELEPYIQQLGELIISKYNHLYTPWPEFYGSYMSYGLSVRWYIAKPLGPEAPENPHHIPNSFRVVEVGGRRLFFDNLREALINAEIYNMAARAIDHGESELL